jgi:hypothetical protein
MPVGALSHEPLTTKSGRADGTSYRRRQPGQRLDQPAGKALNKSTKMGEEVGWRREAGQSTALRGPQAAAQQARKGGQLGGKRREEEGVIRGQKR